MIGNALDIAGITLPLFVRELWIHGQFSCLKIRIHWWQHHDVFRLCKALQDGCHLVNSLEHGLHGILIEEIAANRPSYQHKVSFIEFLSEH